MPYIIGVPKSTFRSLNKPEFGEIVVVDLDKKTYESPNVDLLPTDVFSFLRTQLKSSSEMFLSDSLARSFLRTNVLIFGKYSLGLVKNGMIFCLNIITLFLCYAENKTEKLFRFLIKFKLL